MQVAARSKKVSSIWIIVLSRFSWNLTASSWDRSANWTPPPISRVAASGTRNTFQSSDSKKLQTRAWPVVLPPHGPGEGEMDKLRYFWASKECRSVLDVTLILSDRKGGGLPTWMNGFCDKSPKAEDKQTSHTL